MTKIDPDSSALGNTQNQGVPTKTPKQPPLRKNHFFTYNNYKDEIVPVLVEQLKKFAYKGKIQSEVGDNGTPHLQGMIWCRDKYRDTSFKLPKEIHWETLKDYDNIRDYCGKSETHDGKHRYVWGWPEKYVEEIEDFYPWELDLIERLKTPPNKRDIIWVWEGKGCAGKTTFCKYLHSHPTDFPDCIVLGGKLADMQNGVVEYFELNNRFPKIVIITIPKDHSKIKYDGIETIKDMFFYSGKFHGGMINGRSPHVIVFANEPPDTSKMMMDRWQIIEI